MRHLLRISSVVVALGSPLLAGCASTVAEAYPRAASYAQNDVAGMYQADLRTVLASRADSASRSALSCIILLHHGVQTRDQELARMRTRTAVPTPFSDRGLRPPILPEDDTHGDPALACAAAAGSGDPAIASIGRRYRERASAELGVEAGRQVRAGILLDEVVALLEQGEDNLAFRKYVALKLTAPTGDTASRLVAVEAEHRARFAIEAAFEARSDVRLLRRREAELTEAAARASKRGSWGSRAPDDLQNVRQLLLETHAAFVASHRSTAP